MRSMARSTEPLIVGRVIGDVIDNFAPTAEMLVQYPIRQVSNGCEIKTTGLVDRPRVHIRGSFDSLYTLVMVDPDAPSPSEPASREWVHWIVTDIPAGGDASQAYNAQEDLPIQSFEGVQVMVLIIDLIPPSSEDE
ncbi:hypothetical protein KP509_19G003400 [Ceratopteris richardii]|uniref:MFT-like protein n=1 Tax=Ceratopteris richardii TaxID=49495 RepID=A0A8T2SJN0_CERRI|nr:hypothetical protein KP509_19G003400 [Ceratopteris richardii]